MQSLIAAIQGGAELAPEQVSGAAEALLEENAAVEDKVGFLKALHERGETATEIALFVDAFLKHAVVPPLTADDVDGPMIDVCGTGGDKLDLFNVSTTSIFVLAAGGLTVVKHGNRGITSKSGGADVLEALGVRIDLGPEEFAETIKKYGVGFLFAPRYHPAFKAVVPVRKILAEQGQKTIFNLLGPLLNPVSPSYQMIGVFDESFPPIYADILSQLGRREAWAVHGKTADGRGVDEMSTMGPTQIHRCRQGKETDTWSVSPSDFGMARATVEELQGGDAEINAAILDGILADKVHGAKRDMILLNAGAGFAISGVAEDIPAGIELANECLTSGRALAKLRALQEIG
ncbi:MAG: anthranilate phosphoribosyltransferase [Verrucomicrobiaceae bacterium]|nr:anthranilate phosphoribosyltransferase [Verrucomicrobiaceae bacterium]NCF94601.1 anthranilate phosphoribosyltransferase [Verrucomicrobiaceae bacterium]